MANLDGLILFEDFELWYRQGTAPGIYDYDAQHPYVTTHDELWEFYGTLTDQTPVDVHPQATLPGIVMPGFTDDYYNTIHIVPNPLHMGTVVDGDQARFTVWNAYLTPQELSVINPDNDTGLTLLNGVSVPHTFAPLELQVMYIEVSTAGPPTILAEYEFVFLAETVTLLVTGDRAVVCVFPPDWKTPVKEKIEYMTDVITTIDGSEQRAGLRTAPRRYLTYNTTVIRRMDQYLRAQLWSWLTDAFIIPLWYDASPLLLEAPEGALSLDVDTSNRAFRVGERAVVIHSFDRLEVVKITGVLAQSLTLENELSTTWSRHLMVYPVESGKLANNVSLTRLADRVSKVTLNFEFDVPHDDSLLAQEYPEVHKSLPVFDLQPNWASPTGDTFSKDAQYSDFKTGVIWKGLEADQGSTTQKGTFLITGKANIEKLRWWFYSREGKRVPVWVPSWQNDLTPSRDLPSANTELYVERASINSHYGGIGRREVRIQHRNGVAYYRSVSNLQPISADEEVLTISSVLGVDSPLGTIAQISFMTYARLVSDAMEIQWLTPETANVTLVFRSTNDDV